MIMNPEPHLEQSMPEEQIRETLNKHWNASAAGDANAPEALSDVIVTFPKSVAKIETSVPF